MADTFEVGRVVLGRYRIESVLGSGGMGTVFAATRSSDERDVALKVLRGDSRSDREAHITAALSHGVGATVYDVGRLDSGESFMVMELLRGCDLGELLDRCGWMSHEHACWLILRAVEALSKMHRSGVVHRDIKPENLFLSEDGDALELRVIDFGVAKLRGEREPGMNNVVLGTPAYMSPEQIALPARADERSDIWSLGVTAYELLTGELPFEGDSPGAIITNTLLREPLCPSLRNTRVPQQIARAVLRCLTKEPDDRHRALAELARVTAASARRPGGVEHARQ